MELLICHLWIERKSGILWSFSNETAAQIMALSEGLSLRQSIKYYSPPISRKKPSHLLNKGIQFLETHLEWECVKDQSIDNLEHCEVY